MKQLALRVRLRDDALFESYSPGFNAEILAALRAPGDVPLWLWGARGTGKTHLLQAMCAAAAASPGTREPATGAPATGAPGDGPPAAYFPLQRALALPPEALFGFESCRVLCLDDVDAVAGDVGWERSLFRLFNEAGEQGSRLVFAAAAAPRQAAWVLDDWRSRAAACVVYQLRELDDAGRVEALRQRAAPRGLDLPPETSDYLLRRMPRDLRSLFDVLDRLDEASLMAQRRLTVPFIRDALESLAGTKP
jgi:DnaA family protein